MKVSTIACVLRSFRSRIEIGPVAQIGLYETIAFNIAANELKDENLQKIAIFAQNALTKGTMPVVESSKGMVNLVKKAYKYFDTLDQNKDLKIKDLSKLFDLQEALPEEVLAFADDEWLKKQLEGIDKDDEQHDSPPN
jgi:hypothetical protein